MSWSGYIPGDLVRSLGKAVVIDLLDARTTEQRAEEEDIAHAATRETLTSLPARPGTIR